MLENARVVHKSALPVAPFTKAQAKRRQELSIDDWHFYKHDYANADEHLR